MSVKIQILMACVAGALALGAVRSVDAAKIPVNDEAFFEVRALLQPTAQTIENGAADKTGMGADFYLRRARLILSGTLSKNVSFFIETDAPNFGKAGDYASTVFVQDAFATYKASSAFMVDAGLILLPLNHHATQSAITLNTLDYHSSLVKYPARTQKIWRDTGVQLRGFLLGDRLHYRAGVFGGDRGRFNKVDAEGNALPNINPNSTPRVAGQVRFNLFDAETDFFLGGIYHGKKKVVSFGVGTDYQAHAIATAVGQRPKDRLALAGDIFVDWPLFEDSEVVFQAGVFDYREGRESASSGTGVFGEAGYRWKQIEPVVGYDHFMHRQRPDLDTQALHFGLNYWLDKHATNLKADLTLDKQPAVQAVADLSAATFATVFTLQGQIFF